MTAAARVEFAELLLQEGYIKTPEDYFSVLNGELTFPIWTPSGTNDTTITLPGGYTIDTSRIIPKRIEGEFITPDTKEKKCECGSDSIGSPMHSDWCPKD